MKKKAVVAISIVGGLVVLGGVAAAFGPALYSSYAEGQASAPPSLDATVPSGGSTVDPSDLSGTWNISDGSFAGYRVNEVLNGTDAVVTGRTEKVTGSLSVDGL